MILSRREFSRGATGLIFCATSASALLPKASMAGSKRRYSFIQPGAEWLDTNGKPIQAHGGSLIAVGDSYYWYGENKEFTIGKDSPQSWG
ncbi:MAG TPA: hypothetical protein VN039_04845, partial [Nitrospira sp.]|nr:hypothetical protein [Nitrospira sp.]